MSTPQTQEMTQSVRELRHINTPAAQTWNYLRINDIALTVAEPHATGRVYEAVPRVFDAIECGAGQEATSWIVASAGDARYVEVPRGTVREEPILVASGVGEAHNVAVMVRSGAKATAVVVVDGSSAEADGDPVGAAAEENTPVTSAALLRAYVERGGHLTVLEFICGSATGADADGGSSVTTASQQHLESIGIRAERDATVDVRQYALAGTTAAVGFACDLAGDKSRLDLATRYYASGETTLDINQLCRMRGCDTRAEMFANGVIADNAKKTVRQTIDLVHGAKGAQGDEADTTLVTGDDVVNKTLPTILCDEEDVAGNHGATIGSVSEEQLAYLATRGLAREEAEALFVRALFDDALIHAPEWHSQSAVLARAEEVLGAETARDAAEALDIIGAADGEEAYA